MQDSIVPRPRQRAVLLAGIEFLVLFAALLVPAIQNRQPIINPDTIGYFSSGGVAWDQAAKIAGLRQPEGGVVAGAGASKAMAQANSDGISTQRSVYYGLPVYLLAVDRSLWPLAAAQCLLVSAALLLLGRRLLPARPAWRFAAVAVAGVFGGAAVYAGTAMPDFLGPLMLAGLALLLVDPKGGTPAERLFWLAMIVFAALAHKANLAIGVALIALWCVAGRFRRPALAAAAPSAALLALALAGHVMVSLTVTHILGKAPAEVPFLLARNVADGMVAPYLEAACPQAAPVLCRYRGKLPRTADDFLWGRVPGNRLWSELSPEDRTRLTQEATPVVVASALRAPGAQILAMARNALLQVRLVGMEELLMDVPPPRRAGHPGAWIAAQNRSSAIGERQWPAAFWGASMRLSYALGAAALLVLLWRSRSLLASDRQLRIITWIVAGVLVNAAVCGIVAGPYERYQGRIAWLIPLAALAGLAASRRPRRSDAKLTTSAAVSP